MESFLSLDFILPCMVLDSINHNPSYSAYVARSYIQRFIFLDHFMKSFPSNGANHVQAHFLAPFPLSNNRGPRFVVRGSRLAALSLSLAL